MNGITFQAKVHAVIKCDECDFEAGWYLTAVDDAENHHRETGHELTGEVGLAVWIGKEGAKLLRESNKALFKALGLDEEDEA